MNDAIRDYYQSRGSAPFLIEKRLSKLERNLDIAEDFVYWLTNGRYKDDDCVMVDGYTAESLAKLSAHIAGEDSFLLLIELREDPKRAKHRIAEGFKIK